MEVKLANKKSKELISNQSIKEFFTTKEFPSVPKIPRRKYRISSCHNLDTFCENELDQSLFKRPYSLCQTMKKYQEQLDLKELESNFHIKYELSSIPVTTNIENTSSDQKENSQDYSLQEQEKSNDYKETETEQYQLPEKKETSTKTNHSGVYDTITLINYIQHQFSTWLKHVQKDTYLASSSDNLHDVAKFKYRQTHNTRKIIRSLSLVRLQLLSL